MNKYVFCIIVVIAIISFYMLFIKDEKAKDKPKDLMTHIKEISMEDFKKEFCKDSDEYDTMISFINGKMIVRNGDEKELKDFLKST